MGNATAQAAEGFFAHVFTPPDDEQESAKVFNVLEQIGKGRPLQEIAPELSANTRFYILGLFAKVSTSICYNMQIIQFFNSEDN